jgi:ketopantoate hydroxymethyltransferase
MVGVGAGWGSRGAEATDFGRERGLVAVPTIGIGGSPACDWQIRVIDDMLGLLTEFTPKFVKHYRSLGDEIRAAAREYAARPFPGRHLFATAVEVGCAAPMD